MTVLATWWIEPTLRWVIHRGLKVIVSRLTHTVPSEDMHALVRVLCKMRVRNRRARVRTLTLPIGVPGGCFHSRGAIVVRVHSCSLAIFLGSDDRHAQGPRKCVWVTKGDLGVPPSIVAGVIHES